MANLIPSLSRGSAVALLVAGTLFMENLDGTVILTAMPQMASAFHVHPVDMNIGVSAYLLTLATLIPASGWMADKYSVRSVFSCAIVIFTSASILCGLCQTLTAFTVARVLQGVGGAMMVPVGRLAVLRTAEKHELISAIATITWPGLAAPVLGPPLGGFICTYASWHWIFFLNVPLGVAALVAAYRMIPKESAQAARPFDRLGFILTGTACFALIYGMEMVSRERTPRSVTILTMTGTALIWLLTWLHARRQTHPLVDLRALKIQSYAVTLGGGSVFRMASTALPFLLPLLFQVAFGLSAFRSGMLVLAVFAGNLAMKPLSIPILRRFPFRSTLLINGALNACIIFACALLSPTTPTPVIVALLFVSGLSRSMQFGALNTLAFADVPEGLLSGANTLYSMVQQMSMAIGIALGAVALRVASLLFPGSSSGAIPVSHFQTAFMIVGVIALLEIVDVFRLDRTAGNNVRGLQPAED